MKPQARFALPFVAMICLLGSAQADPVTFHFSGQVSAIIHDDIANTFSANFAVGDSVTGSFSFDTSASGTVIFPYLESYPASFNAYVNGHHFFGGAQYRIFNDGPGGDGFSIVNEDGSYSAPALGTLVPSTFFLQFLGMPTSTLSDLSLVTDPAALVPLADPWYAPNGLRLYNRSNSDDYGALYFTIDSVKAVPDSGATLALLGSTLLGIAALRRRFAA
ncbi:MAG TPA: VPDSG-CTERM sorting domain-containing protein [Lacunisphaera sp.]